MGLDQYAFVTTRVPDSPVDFESPEDASQIQYWRKHANLQGWMENLYWQRKGTEPQTTDQNKTFGSMSTFNCVNLALLPEDIERLEEDVLGDHLPYTTGFFFGSSQPEDKEADLEFIAKAREAFSEGKCVYYTSWW